MDAFMNLDAVLADTWERLRHGVIDPKHPFRLAVLGTSGLTGGITLRTVVVREVNDRGRRILCHTDARSPKVEEVRATSRVAWLLYDPTDRIQVRLGGTASIHTDDSVADRHWADASPLNRRCYLAPMPPGARCSGPDPNLPAIFLDRAPTLTESEAGRAHFAVVSCEIETLDWLHLRAEGHVRARFRWDDDERIHAEWLAP